MAEENIIEKKPAKILLREIADKAYQDAWDAKARGEKVGWCASNFPQEITTAMGIKVVYPENQAAAIAAKGGALKMLEHSEGKGYSNDICAYARISLAFADIKESAEMDMPQPDFVLCCNNICNCMIKWYENLAYELNIPIIMIDIPYNPENTVSEDRIRYIRAQFDNAIRQLEEITGKTFSEEKLKEVMEISLRSSRAWLKATDYCQYTPSPLNGYDLFNHMAVAVCARGTVEAAEAFEQLAEEYEEMVKTGGSTFKGEQKFRIMFEGIACWPHLRHTYSALKDYGMNVVATVYGPAFGFIYENMNELAAAYSNVPNCISLDNAAKLRTDLAKRNGIEGAVIHTNRSCKLWSGIMPEIERRIREEAGVPTITFDGDQADPRNFSEAQYDTRVQGLYEVMTANKSKEGN
ncbi:MAG TPA: 2-hydroxyacyl-CoA dehydratase family protein [Bacillota bacterium]|nr:2-hydroxyacyl-CoA dehydratase family protein [Bacillota bacterium]